MSYLYLVLFLGFGLFFIKEILFVRISDAIKGNSVQKKIIIAIFTGAFLLIPLYMFFINFSKTDLHNFELGNWLGYDILNSVDNNALVLLFADSMLFNGQYIYYSNNKPNNIKIIKGGSTQLPYYRMQIKREFPEVLLPDNFLEANDTHFKYVLELIKANAIIYPVYSGLTTPQVEGYKWVKYGLLYKLTPEEEEISIYEYDKKNREVISKFKYSDFTTKFGYTGFIISHLKDPYYNSLINIAEQLIELGGYEESLYYLEQARKIKEDEKGAYVYLGLVNLRLENCDEGIINLEKSFEIDNQDVKVAQALSQAYLICYKDEEKSNQYKNKFRQLENQVELFEKK